MIANSLQKNFIQVLRRTMDSAWWGKDVTGVAKAPAILNAETMDAVNAAGTGLVQMIGVDSSNNVNLPNGAVVPLGKTLTVNGTFTSGGLSFTMTLAALTTNGAVSPHTTADYVITKAGVLADTLAAPTATTDDGVVICIVSTTANAHTLTATGLLNTGTAAVNLATFAAYAGAGLTLLAYQAKWYVLSSVGVTFS